MPESVSEEFVLGKWVREQLEKGDDPKVLYAALKNRGMNPDIVEHVLSSLKKNPLKKIEPEKKALQKKFFNYALRREIDKMLFSKENTAAALPPGIPQKEAGEMRGEKESSSGKAAISALEAKTGKRSRKEGNRGSEIPTDEKSLFSLFAARISESMPRIKIGFPKLSPLAFNNRLAIILGILGAALIIALLVSFGLNWYADRMARTVFG